MDDFHTAWQRLVRRWEKSKERWDDPVRREFERNYWQPLAQETQSTAREIEQLTQVLAKAQRSVR